MTNNMEKLPKDSFERITIDSSHAEKISKPSLSFWQDAWLRIRKNKAAIVSMFILVFIVIHGICWTFMVEHDPEEVKVAHANLPPKVPGLEKLGIFDGVGKLGSKTVDLYELKKVESITGLGRIVLDVICFHVFGKEHKFPYSSLLLQPSLMWLSVLFTGVFPVIMEVEPMTLCNGLSKYLLEFRHLSLLF